MKIYISFGQSHAHSVNGKTFDKDCLAEIECIDFADGRKKAFEAFGPVFAACYLEEDIKDTLKWFPRGIIKLN